MKFNIFGKKSEEKKKTLEDFAKKEDDEVIGGEEVKEEETEAMLEQEEASSLDCFGLSDKKAEGWLVKCAKIWHGIMSFAWFLFGALTFAPIIFISRKINVLFNDKKKSMIVAAIFHLVVLALLIIFLSARMRSCAGA